MSQQYLMIENKGIAPVEGFTLLGVGTTGGAGIDGSIGMFATGAKQSINLLIRNGIPPTIFCDKLCLEFGTEGIVVDEYINKHKFKQVTCRLTGKDIYGKQVNRTEKLGWTTDFGQHDWNNLRMAVREFISNAIDRTLKEDLELSEIKLEVVPAKSVRAKTGHTRVFIPLNDELKDYYLNIDRYFLHWFKGVDTQKDSVLKKACRETNPGAAVIYKKGVFVREMHSNVPSMYDYNINDLRLDECRNADDYSVRTHIGYELAYANDNVRENIIRALKNNSKYVETTMVSSYDLNNALARVPAIAARWQESWNKICGPKTVICSGTIFLASYIENKGYIPVIIENTAWRNFLEKCGIDGERKVLTQEEQEGITYVDTTFDTMSGFNEIWTLLEKHKMTGNKKKPALKCFTKNMDGGTQLKGYYKNNTVFIHNDIAKTRNNELLTTILEECVHHITGAGDLSRDIQEFAFKLVIAMLMN